MKKTPATLTKDRAPADQAGPGLLALMPSPVQNYVANALQQIGAMGDDEDSLWRASEAGGRMEMAGRLIAGRANLELSTRVEKRQLVEELRRRSIQISGFYYQIDVYRALESLPDQQKVEALASLGFTKNRAIASWRPDERLALASGAETRGITLDQAVEMSSRDFEQAQKQWAQDHDEALRKARSEAESARAREEAAKNELQRERQDALKRARESGLPAFAFGAREDAVALTGQMEVCLDGLEGLLRLLEAGSEARRDPDAAATAAGTTYHLLLGVQARAQTLLGHLAELLSVNDRAVPGPAHRLSEPEIARALQQREVLLGRAEAEAHNRKAERENNRAGRKGRKLKTRDVE